MSDSTPVLRLKKNEERRLLAGHMWVYSNEIDTAATPLKGLEPGCQVALHSSRDQFIAMAYANPQSLISARVYSHRRDQSLDRDLLVARLQAALQWRDQCYGDQCYRLVHGEGDWLPGVIIDRFGSHVVVQANTAGAYRLLGPLTDACKRCLSRKVCC